MDCDLLLKLRYLCKASCYTWPVRAERCLQICRSIQNCFEGVPPGYRGVDAASGLLILSSKSCDGAPASIVRRIKAAHVIGKRKERWGYGSCEFLVKHQFMRTYTSKDIPMTRRSFDDPMVLRYGKTARAIFFCSLEERLGFGTTARP